ncbi:MAG: hypothetical protein WB681_12100 [Candidatus Cybelea sp.]
MSSDLLPESCRGWLGIALANQARDDDFITLLTDVRITSLEMAEAFERAIKRYAQDAMDEERKAIYARFYTSRDRCEATAKQADEAMERLNKFPPYPD